MPPDVNWTDWLKKPDKSFVLAAILSIIGALQVYGTWGVYRQRENIRRDKWRMFWCIWFAWIVNLAWWQGWVYKALIDMGVKL